jgi:hypothetical protein
MRSWTVGVVSILMALGVKASGTTTYTLSGGAEMPQVGLGVYQSDPGEQTYNAVRWALELGYRLVDTVMCSLVFVLCTYLLSKWPGATGCHVRQRGRRGAGHPRQRRPAQRGMRSHSFESKKSPLRVPPHLLLHRRGNLSRSL